MEEDPDDTPWREVMATDPQTNWTAQLQARHQEGRFCFIRAEKAFQIKTGFFTSSFEK